MTSSDDLRHKIPSLVATLTEAAWPTTEAESVAFLRRHGFVLSDNAPDKDGLTISGEMATPFSGVTGHWTICAGALESISIFACETAPTNRDQLSKAFVILDEEFCSLFGEAATDISLGDAPQSSWEIAGHTVSLDCHWNGDRIGVVQLAIEPTNSEARTA
ncbi:DUF6301 family protein [Luethyella okanaganae]|uniref:DUF6301 family protein n=1 Tax=Luethyella okanaganae TaxID=69372 RepID=A0ABW1VCP8_9MICO